MAQINFEEVLKQLESGLTQLAETTLSDYLKEAKSDTQQLLGSLKTDLQKWTTELANGEITEKNLVYLINSKKALFEMNALALSELAAIRREQFQNSALQLISSTIVKCIKL